MNDVTQRKGIILAGGSGTRLYPITVAVSKQLLPIYDKPMIYYPLSRADAVRHPRDRDHHHAAGRRSVPAALGDGSQWGLASPTSSSLARRTGPGLSSGRGFPGRRALGHGAGRQHLLRPRAAELLGGADARASGGTVFGYQVADPERYGVVAFDADGMGDGDHREARGAAVELCGHRALLPRRHGAGPGAQVKPSARGELEITSLLEMYPRRGTFRCSAWGAAMPGSTPARMASLLDAGNFVRTLEARQGLQSGCPEEIAYEQGWIDRVRRRSRPPSAPARRRAP
jgi:glucose-1-phosphate thymidylyltransferase